jgi:hypothetical protein
LRCLDGDEPVPVLEDFNRLRRFYTVDKLDKFTNASTTNYKTMFNSNDEFENYENHGSEKLKITW